MSRQLTPKQRALAAAHVDLARRIAIGSNVPLDYPARLSAAMLGLVHAAANYDGQRDFRKYAASACCNQIKDDFRKWRRGHWMRKPPKQVREDIDTIRSESGNPQDEIDACIDFEVFRHRTFGALRPRELDVIKGYLASETLAESAERLGVTISAVETARNRAFHRLRDAQCRPD